MAEAARTPEQETGLDLLDLLEQQLRGPPPAEVPFAAGGAPRLVSFARQQVQPRPESYLEYDLVLRLGAANSRADLTLLLQGRYLSTEGEVLPFAFEFSPPATRVPTSVDFPLAEGFLLNAEVAINDPTPVSRGECYVLLALRRGRITGSFEESILLADYASTFWAPSFPYSILRPSLEGPGFLRTIVGTNPAAGAEVSETVPTGARWKLRGVRAGLVADATVANRRVRLGVTRSGNTIHQVSAGQLQTAGTTLAYNFAPYGAWLATFPNEDYAPLPLDLTLKAGDVIETQTLSLQAGDNWGVPLLDVEEWIDT